MSKAGVEPMLNTFVSGSLISQEVQYSTVKRIHLPCEIVTVLTVSMQQDQRLALAFFYEMMLDVHAGMSCDPESATFASPEYRILDPDIEPTVRLKLRHRSSFCA